MSKHKSEDYKISAVKYFIENNDTQENVCKIFKCSPKSLMRWVNQYKKEGNVNKHYRKPIAYKEKNMKIYLKVLMKDQKNMYQKIKQEKLRSSINKFLCRMTYIKFGV